MALPNRRASYYGVAAMALTIGVCILFAFFAVFLRVTPLLNYVPASLSAIFAILSVFLMLYSMLKQLRQHNIGRLLPLSTLAVCILSAILYFATLSWMSACLNQLPRYIFGATTSSLVYATFIICAASLAAQCLYVLAAIDFSRQAVNERGSLDIEASNSSEMQANSSRSTPSSFERSLSPPLTGDSYKHFKTDTDLHHAPSRIVYPMPAKIRQPVYSTQKDRYRSSSLDSGTSGVEAPMSNPFDSWDVDVVSTSAVMSFSPAPLPISSNSPHPSGSGRFLPTIPASPTESPCPSPGFLHDLEAPPLLGDGARPPATPIASRPTSRRTGAVSPVSQCRPSYDSGVMESHIHPLFRTDSPEPPPISTPGTIVTAAPGAGHIISGLASLQSISRMRSGSLPSTSAPPAYAKSIHSQHGTIEDIVHELARADRERHSAADSDMSAASGSGGRTPPERTMTPPIPEWILGAGNRSSLAGYSKRKNSNPSSTTRLHGDR